jgi:hypothetical protein
MVTSGKEHLDFTLYKVLAMESLKKKEREFIFCHCFIVLA